MAKAGKSKSYFSRWLREAFWRSPSAIDLWSGLAGAGLTAIGHIVPAWQTAVNNLVWQVPLWAAGGIVIARLVLAPYWLAKEDAATIANLEDKVRPDRRRIAIKARLGDALFKGGEIHKRAGTTPDGDAAYEQEAQQWNVETAEFLVKALGEGEAQLYQTGSGLTVYEAMNVSNTKIRSGIDYRMQRLAQILQRMDTSPINPDFDPEKDL